MLRSKSSRSGLFDFRQKDRSSSRFTRSISIPKICRGDPVLSDINRDALLPKKSYIAVNSPKNQLSKLSNMQMSRFEEDERITNQEKNLSMDANIQFHESNGMVNKSKSKKELKSGNDFEIRTAIKIKELEDEIERLKLAEAKMFESFVSQTKHFEETKIELEESKLEIMDLQKQVEQSQDLKGVLKLNHFGYGKDAVDSLKRDLAHAKQEAKESDLRAKSLLHEINVLKNELNSATSAEETSKKAMDDLALALQEVATEANLTKKKYGSAGMKLEQVKSERDHLKEIVRETEEKYQKLLEESVKEAERQKNMAERLRMEAEDSLTAWNGKEKGFVDCIRINEEERTRVQQENLKLKDSIKAAKAETTKMRDIMKQALNEANVAKVAAGIARDENSQLKDSIEEKDEIVRFLTQENERLTKELKRLLKSIPVDSDDTDTDTVDTDESKPKEMLSFDLEKAEALKGSIFDTAESPESEPHTPDLATAAAHDDSDHDGSRFEDADGKINHRRRKSAMFKKFGDIILKKSYLK